AFMLVFIVPAFAKVYRQFNAELPVITRTLMLVSTVVINWWYIVILVGIGIALLIRAYVKTPRGRLLWDRAKLKMPLLGKLIRKMAIARFTQTFAGVTKAGVPILKALAVSANTSGNIVIIDAVMTVANFVKEGASISVPLEQTGEFPPMVTRMIAAGEQSG